MLQRESSYTSVKQMRVTEQLVDGELRAKLLIQAVCFRFINKALAFCDTQFGLPLQLLCRNSCTFGTERSHEG